MAHRLLHSLVFSSVMALEGLGCAFSHPRDVEPDPPEPPEPPFDPIATGPAAGSLAADGGTDGDPGDAGDPRFCEPGWPTTKASYCQTIEEEDRPPRIECCNYRYDPDAEAGRATDCCIQPEGA